jgi:hypothetical protein
MFPQTLKKVMDFMTTIYLFTTTIASPVDVKKAIAVSNRLISFILRLIAELHRHFLIS